MGTTSLIILKQSPEEKQVSKVILADKLNEPMELSVLDNDRIYL